MAGTLIIVLFLLVVLVMIGQSLNNLKQESRTASLNTMQQAVEQAVMQCYALEGAYPPDLDYLQAHYGLLLDHDRLVYLYEVVGSNVYPIVAIQHLEDAQQ